MTIEQARQIVAIAIAGLLAGCDAATNKAYELAADNSPTIVISEGYQIEVGGQKAPIQGFDKCPKADATTARFFGPATDAGKTTCVILGKDRTNVQVLIGLPSGTVQETWKIVRETGKTESGRPYSLTSLRRPDGNLVVPVNGNESLDFYVGTQHLASTQVKKEPANGLQ